jgi:predicted TIM-barrel fold metal-dependent hydrolase
MITDCHVHIGKATWPHLDIDAKALLAEADRVGIERMMITDLTALTYDMEEGNEWIRTQIAVAPDRLLGYFTITSPRYRDQAVEDLERYVTDYGFRGLKIYSVPPLMLIDDPYMIPILEKAAELRIPVLAHSTGEECLSLCRQVPELIILNAHMGCCPQAHGDWHRSIAMAKQCPNIYLDTTSSSFDNGMIEHAVEELGAERIVYGSDVPLLDPRLQIAKVMESDLTDAEKRLILQGNIERLLALRDAA